MNAPQRRKEWQEFKEWCEARKLKAFPAHPWTVSVYLLWLDAHRRTRTLQKRLDIILRVHMCACIHSPDRDPLIKRTLAAIEKRRHKAPSKIFKGQKLLEPKRRKVNRPQKAVSKKTRLFGQIPSLVLRRPPPEA